MEKRWVVRRSEPVKAVLLSEERVYPGKAQVNNRTADTKKDSILRSTVVLGRRRKFGLGRHV